MQDLMKWGTTNNKNQRFFRLVWVILGAVMLYEVFIYSGLGYYQYPYVRSVPLWLMKHVLIVAGVIGWLVLVAKVNVATSGRRLRKILASILLFIVGGAIFAWVVEIGKPAGGFFYSPLDESYTAPFAFVLLYMPVVLVFLTGLRLITKKASDKTLTLLAILGGIVAATLIAHVLFTQWILSDIPLDKEFLRGKETRVIGKGWKEAPEQYGTRLSPRFVRTEQFPQGDREIESLHRAAEKLTIDQWGAVCQKVKWASLGQGILGSKAASSCWYVGAIIYEEPLFCEKTTEMVDVCRADLALLLGDIAVCKGEKDCMGRNPGLLNQEGMSCESLITEEDKQVPFYTALGLTPYAECQRRTLQEQQKTMTWSENTYRLAMTKLIINEWYADTDNPDQSYVELKNISNNTIVLKDVEINRIPLPAMTMAPNEIVVFYGSDLRKLTVDLSRLFLPIANEMKPLLSRELDLSIFGGQGSYTDVPANMSTGAVNLQPLREGKYYDHWQEVYQLMPPTPGEENNVIKAIPPSPRPKSTPGGVDILFQGI